MNLMKTETCWSYDKTVLYTVIVAGASTSENNPSKKIYYT